MSEVYKIGVHILLTDSVSAGLSAISHKLLGIHKSVKDVEGGFGKWKLAIGGAASVFAGSALLKGMAKLAEHAKEYQHELAKARALGLDNTQMTQVAQQAWQNTRNVPGVDAAHGVKTIGSLYSIVGLEEALKLSPGFEKSDQVLGNLGKGQQGSAYTLARAGELMGKFTDATGHLDVARFSSFLDVINKAVIATHGMVSAKDWLNYSKQAGPASANLTDDGMLTTSVLIQAMGGHRAGTAAAAITRQFAGGIMTQRVAKELERLGIAQQGDFTVGRGGQVIAKTGAMQKIVEHLGKDPLAAMIDDVMPALEKKGLTGDKMAGEIYRFIGTGPAQREVYELLRGIYQIQQERQRAKGAMGVDAATQNFSQTDPLVVQKNAGVAFNNMLTALGNNLLLAAIPGMLKITDLFNEVSKFANAHPDAIRNLAIGVTALGAAFVGAGIVAIGAAAGSIGLVVAGVSAFGAMMLMIPWTSLGPAFKAVGDAALLVISPLTALAAKIASIGSAIMNFLGMPAAGSPAVGPNNHGGRGGTSTGHGFLKQGYNAVPPGASPSQHTSPGDIYMDGRKVGEIVSKHQARAANGPLQGGASFDASAAWMPADYSSARG